MAVGLTLLEPQFPDLSIMLPTSQEAVGFQDALSWFPPTS